MFTKVALLSGILDACGMYKYADDLFDKIDNLEQHIDRKYNTIRDSIDDPDKFMETLINSYSGGSPHRMFVHNYQPGNHGSRFYDINSMNPAHIQLVSSYFIMPNGDIAALNLHHGDAIEFAINNSDLSKRIYDMGLYKFVHKITNGAIRVYVSLDKIVINAHECISEQQSKSIQKITESIPKIHTYYIEFIGSADARQKKYFDGDVKNIAKGITTYNNYVSRVLEYKKNRKLYIDGDKLDSIDKLNFFRRQWDEKPEKYNLFETLNDISEEELQNILESIKDKPIPVEKAYKGRQSIAQNSKDDAAEYIRENLGHKGTEEFVKDFIKGDKTNWRHRDHSFYTHAPDVTIDRNYDINKLNQYSSAVNSYYVLANGSIVALDSHHASAMNSYLNMRIRDQQVIDAQYDLSSYDLFHRLSGGAIRVFIDDIGDYSPETQIIITLYDEITPAQHKSIINIIKNFNIGGYYIEYENYNLDLTHDWQGHISNFDNAVQAINQYIRSIKHAPTNSDQIKQRMSEMEKLKYFRSPSSHTEKNKTPRKLKNDLRAIPEDVIKRLINQYKTQDPPVKKEYFKRKQSIAKKTSR